MGFVCVVWWWSEGVVVAAVAGPSVGRLRGVGMEHLASYKLLFVGTLSTMIKP